MTALLDLADLQAAQMREDQAETAGLSAGQGMLHNTSRPLVTISSWPGKILTRRPHPRTACCGIANRYSP